MNIQSLHPYYLQQMGIEPWLLRPRAPQPCVKLMVVGVGLERENRLLMNMLKSIDLSTQDACIFSVEPSGSLDACLKKIKEIAPLVLFAMGDIATIDEVKTHYPRMLLIKSHPLVNLISDPVCKKKAYRDLLDAQQWLVAC